MAQLLDTPRLLRAAERGPRTYGKGRICAREGCGAHLSQYNPGCYCQPCIDNKLLGRRVPKEREVDVGASQAQQGIARQRVGDFLEHRGDQSSMISEIVSATGLGPSSVDKYLRELVKAGKARRVGLGRYVLGPAETSAGECQKPVDNSGAEVTPAASGPTPPREDETPAPAPAAASQAPVPFAGLLSPLDDELQALGTCVRALESLELPALTRVLAYLQSRFE